MDLKLVKTEYHKKEKKDYTDEWWILVFRSGENTVTKRIENEDYDATEWNIGAKYTFHPIEIDDVIKTSIKHSDGKVQSLLPK